MNWHLTLQRLRGRPTCVRHATTKILRQARIINIGRESSQIPIGAHSVIEGELLVFAHGGRIQIGEWCFVGRNTNIWSGRSVEIGDRVLIAHGVNVFDNLTHPMAPSARHDHFRHIMEKGHPDSIDLGDRPVVIEPDAWIGAGAIVLRGTRIGRGAIVGAGAVVTADVAPMTIVAGNPARFIRAVGDPASPL
jgi:acetyltransferase-like isoleucine patch superfamily enzyme